MKNSSLPSFVRSSALALACGGLLAFGGCATSRAPSAAAGPPAVTTYEMEEVHVQATEGPAGLQIESFDAAELFEHAGTALSQGKQDEAIRLYDRVLKTFPDSGYVRASMYNRGLAYRDKKQWPEAITSFKELVDKHGDHADAKDALFQMGACYAELENWPTSAETFAGILARKDLTADDRIEALARRGFAQFNLKDVDTAEKTFRQVLIYKRTIEAEERLATDFYLAFSQYHLAQIVHERFRQVQLRLPEKQMDRDLELKAQLLLEAQRGYIATINYKHPGWASAAGFQVGSLYEELYAAFVQAPVPPALGGDAREVYLDELRKKIRILLEKSLRWQRENLLMVERVGVNTEWAEKSKTAYAKLLRLLDPNARPEVDAVPRTAPPPGPVTPAAPDRTRPPEPVPTDRPGNDDIGPRQIL